MALTNSTDWSFRQKINKTFKCEVNRADKSFPIKSNDFAADLGEIILKNNDNAKVDIHSPETTV